MANKTLQVTSLNKIVKQPVAGHAPGWSSSLFVFEDFNGDIGKCLPWNTEHCKSSEFVLKADIEIEFLGQHYTPNSIKSQLLAAYLLARKLQRFVSLAWFCCAPKGVAISCQVGQQG